MKVADEKLFNLKFQELLDKNMAVVAQVDAFRSMWQDAWDLGDQAGYQDGRCDGISEAQDNG